MDGSLVSCFSVSITLLLLHLGFLLHLWFKSSAWKKNWFKPLICVWNHYDLWCKSALMLSLSANSSSTLNKYLLENLPCERSFLDNWVSCLNRNYQENNANFAWIFLLWNGIFYKQFMHSNKKIYQIPFFVVLAEKHALTLLHNVIYIMFFKQRWHMAITQ